MKVVAEICGTSIQTISRLECGVAPMTLDWLERLCMALEIPPGLLFDDVAVAQLAEREELCAEITGLAIHLQRINEHVGRFLQYADPPSEWPDAQR